MRPMLHHTPIAHPDSTPMTDAWLLHGILGSGRNLRTFAQKLVKAVPTLRLWLVDHRGHGESPPGEPPQTLDACVADLTALAVHLGIQPAAALGHSFGGKVALAWARQKPLGLQQVWVLDALPGPGTPEREASDASVVAVVQALRAIPLPLPDRQALGPALAAQGISPAVIAWMSTNLRPVAGGFSWKFDLDVVEALLASYFAVDLWPVLETPPPGVRIDVVRAGRSQRWTKPVLDQFAAVSSHQPERVALHVLPAAGHWLHVDDPDGLVALLAPGLGKL